MGFFDSAITWVTNAILGGASSGAAQQSVTQAAGEIAQQEARDWVRDILTPKPVDQLAPYDGEGFSQIRSGWPIQLAVEAVGSAGTPPAGTFFVGHLPVCLFDSLRMTMSAPSLEDDPRQQSGALARVVQRDADGRTVFVSGIELGYQEDGTLVRQDLRLPARSPLVVEENYGGAVIESLPTFIVVASYGSWSGVPSLEETSVQVTLTILCQTLT